MKTTIVGYEPNAVPLTTIEVVLESVSNPAPAGLVWPNADAQIDVRLGDRVARLSLRELSAAILGMEKAVPPPPPTYNWTLQGLYGPNETVIPPQWPPRPY